VTASDWQPTVAHVRATTGGVLLAVAAVLLRRPDVLVLATPLLVVAVWSAWLRPRRNPGVVQRLGHQAIREGEATTWHIDVTEDPGAGDDLGRAEDVAAVLAAPSFSTLVPRAGVVCDVVRNGGLALQVSVRSARWGRRAVGPAQVVATSAWAAFRWTAPRALARTLSTLPLPAVFDSSAPPVHPVGLVGLARSGRAGDGNEFASIRPFQAGDRLRRIHWPRSLRTGTLHVTSTWADQDSHVVIVVDALNDLGISEGIDGQASSLDVTVRAAGAIAEHHLHRGDRVAVHVVGAKGVVRVPAASGSSHLRRVLDTLSAIEPGTDLRDHARLQFGLPAGALVVMLSPLVSPLALQRAFTLATRGMTVVVVDTLPPGIVEDDPDDPFHGLAWRIRLLERRRELRSIQHVGVPVVQWRGPGSLDQVLRDLSRHAATPRMARR
jgi:uncharacterized protein (DUF58 family)